MMNDFSKLWQRWGQVRAVTSDGVDPRALGVVHCVIIERMVAVVAGPVLAINT
jgi:hypothetical protein